MQAPGNKTTIEAGNTTIGGFLQALRKSRRLTITQAAQQAGLHRTTLDRWEKGDTLPRLSELNALLAVLGADARQQQQALQLMEAPRAVRQVRAQLEQVAQRSGMPSLPNGGDLLYALRMRQGLSLEDATRRVEVTGGTLRRWEKMELWPSLEQLHRLCYALAAHEEEIVALTLGQFSRTPHVEKSSVETILARLEDLKALSASHWNSYPLFELGYLQLEADAWPLALRSAVGKQALIEVYAYHAQTLSTQERLVEAGRVADQAIELMWDKLKPQRGWMYSVIVSARAHSLGGNRLSPKRGLERLRPWSSMTQWPDMHSWMLADMAKYLSLSGETEAALTLAERSSQVDGIEGEGILRRWDKAALLLAGGRPAEALTIVQESSVSEAFVNERIQVSLLRAEAYLGVGHLSEAHDWLQRAQSDVDTHHIEYMRPRLERLTARF